MKKKKIIKLLGVPLILSMLVLSIISNTSSGELPPTYGYAMPTTSQSLINI